MTDIENKNIPQKIITTIKSLMQNIFDYTSPHFKVFFIIIIIAVIFIIFWTIIKPENDIQQKIIGVVPFPNIELNVPPDATLCGTSPQIADDNDPMCTKCIEKSGKNQYEPVYINHPNVWYLGVQLPEGKKYCLPKKAYNAIHNCGTYTGKAILANTDQGTEWKCDCLYPDFFNGDTCTDSNLCSYKDENGTIQTSHLTNSQGITWDPLNMDISLVGINPHEVDSNGKAIFQCRNCPNGYYNTEDQPYRCQKDLCYNGFEGTPAAYFDVNTKSCVCDPTSNMTKSNITGFCYTDQSGVCKPHIITGKCTFNIDISGIIFKLNGIIYVSIERNDPISKKTYQSLVNLTEANLPSVNIDDLSKTVLKDSFYAYPIVQWHELTSEEQNTINNTHYKQAIETLNTRLINNLNNDQIVSGYGIPCNSFFYQHDPSLNLPNCQDLNIVNARETNTALNKTGYAFNPFCTENCNQTHGTCKIDITKDGYQCECPQDTIVNPINGGCNSCLSDDISWPYDAGNNLCCTTNEKPWMHPIQYDEEVCSLWKCDKNYPTKQNYVDAVGPYITKCDDYEKKHPI